MTGDQTIEEAAAEAVRRLDEEDDDAPAAGEGGACDPSHGSRAPVDENGERIGRVE